MPSYRSGQMQFGQPDSQPVVRQDGERLSSSDPTHVHEAIRMRKPAEELTLQDVSLVLIDFGVRFRPSQAARFKSHVPIDIRKAIKKILVDNRSGHKGKCI